MLYLILTSWNYAVCISMEIVIRIRSPMGYGFRKRSVVYHLFSNITGLTALFTAVFLGGTGDSSVRICLTKDDSWANWLMGIPLVFHFPFSLSVVAYSWYISKTKISQHMKRFLSFYPKALLIYTLVWIPLPLVLCLEHMEFNSGQIINEIAIFLVAICGFIINMIRVKEKSFRNLIIKAFRKLRSSDNSSLKTERQSSLLAESFLKASRATKSMCATIFSGFFSEIYTEAIITSLVAIHLTMKRSDQNAIKDDELLPLE